MIYLDYAATSWPKPPEVIRAMTDVMERAGGNPGRSGHRLSVASARVVYGVRENIARFFGINDDLRVIFTHNATHAINLALRGILKPGDRVITSSMEHNSVMRPLTALEKKGILVSTIPCGMDGILNIAHLGRIIDSRTKLVVVTHASNVVGTIFPISEVARMAHQYGALLLVDAAQTAGAIPINMSSMGIDLLAFTGHKELLGPTGIGGLVIGDGVDINRMEPLTYGGTGSRSESVEQPQDLPDKYESGTANVVGIAGLGAGLDWISDRKITELREHQKELTRILLEDLSVMPGVKVYGTHNPERSISVVSFTTQGKRVSEIGMRLDEEYGILTRVGLHCAPVAHRTIGTFPEGTVRVSPGVFTSINDIKEAVRGIGKVLSS